jgi:hypothetical protein
MSSEDDPSVLQALRHIPSNDPLRQAFYDSGLPTPGSPISTGLFLVLREST